MAVALPTNKHDQSNVVAPTRKKDEDQKQEAGVLLAHECHDKEGLWLYLRDSPPRDPAVRMSLFGYAAHDHFRVGVAVALRACRFDHAQRRVVAHAIGADHDLVRVAGRFHVADERPHARTLRAPGPLRPCRARWSWRPRCARIALRTRRSSHANLALKPRRPREPRPSSGSWWPRRPGSADVALGSLRTRRSRVAFGCGSPRRTSWPDSARIALRTGRSSHANLALRSRWARGASLSIGSWWPRRPGSADVALGSLRTRWPRVAFGCGRPRRTSWPGSALLSF